MGAVSGPAEELPPGFPSAPLEAEPAGAAQAESSSPDRSRQITGFHNFIAGPPLYFLYLYDSTFSRKNRTKSPHPALDRWKNVYYNELQVQKRRQRTVPRAGVSEMGWPVRIPRRRGGRHSGRGQAMARRLPPRYGGRVCTSGTNSGGTTDRLIRPEPFPARGVFIYSVRGRERAEA